MTELIALFHRAAAGFGQHVHAVADGQWHDPTPCTDWDVRTLVNHVTVEQLWVPPLVQGSSVADVGDRLDGDQLGDDPVATWDARGEGLAGALRRGGRARRHGLLSAGDRAAAEYCWEMTTDALIHSWDLARGIGADEDARRRARRARLRADAPDRRAPPGDGTVRAARTGSRRRAAANEAARAIRSTRVDDAASRSCAASTCSTASPTSSCRI